MSTSSGKLKAEDLLGTWRLSAFEGRAEDGTVTRQFGDRPEGMIAYHADGTMMVVIMKPDRPIFESKDMYNGSDEEIRAAFNGFLGYCGRFTIDPQAGTVTHHLEQAHFPNWIGTRQVRYVKLSDNQLSLSSPPILANGKQVTFYLIWRR